ncbi:MAG: IS200/IS605 family transposase [Planctomycetes bacterium]|nr:IS200/IS605 family transposase [Planctomycetota bacterium]
MAHTFICLQYHLVFSTKDRKRFLSPDCTDRIHGYMGGIIRNIGGEILCVGGTVDHVHVLCSLRADMCVAEAVRTIKCNTSKWMHETMPSLSDFAWQEGYGAFTVSWLNMDAVVKYISGQARHHKKTTFQEEFVHLLKRHGIAYDEQYLWV